MSEKKSIRELFPEDSRLLLTGGGKEFIERIGVEAARQVVLSVMQGENIRTQTEPLSRRRIAQVSGAIVALYANGLLQQEDFTQQLSALALQQIAQARKNDNASVWPAQWLIGLTGKSVQNVLRSKPEAREDYITDFEDAVKEAAEKCREEIGDLQMTLGYLQDETGRTAALGWEEITRLTTAIGSATLTIRGSDKSIYGKLFERKKYFGSRTAVTYAKVTRRCCCLLGNWPGLTLDLLAPATPRFPKTSSLVTHARLNVKAQDIVP